MYSHENVRAYPNAKLCKQRCGCSVLVAPSDILNASDNFVGDLMKSLTIITDFFALFPVFK